MGASKGAITTGKAWVILIGGNLAPDIQQAILDHEPTTDPVPRFRDREVRTIAILPNWEKQRESWTRLVGRKP
jgi:hypothetical protein